MKYTRGAYTTDRGFNRPTIAAISAWYDDMKLVIERSEYKGYITGRCLTDIKNTMDVDIVYTGKLNTTTLEQLLITSVIIGFRHNLLIDARWQSSIETAEYKDGKIKILPTEFIYLNYYEHDDEQGYKTINDYRLNPAYKVVSEHLVSSTYDRVAKRLKPHLEAYIVKHGKLAIALLEDKK